MAGGIILSPSGMILERRIRRMEEALDSKSAANPLLLTLDPSAIPDPAAANASPPQVSGLSLTSAIGKVNLTWNASTITNLRHYEILLADNEDFILPTTVKLTQTFYTHNDAVTDREYWFKVRAVNTLGNLGAYSPTQSSRTGLVDTSDIAPRAISGTAYRSSPEEITMGPGVNTEIIKATFDREVLNSSTVMIWATVSVAAFGPNAAAVGRWSIDRVDTFLDSTNQTLIMKRDMTFGNNTGPQSVMFMSDDVSPGSSETYILSVLWDPGDTGSLDTVTVELRSMFCLEIRR